LWLKQQAREAGYFPSSADIKKVELLASSILAFRRIFGRTLNKIKATLCRRISSVIDLCSVVDIYCYLGALMNAIMNLGFHKMQGISWPVEDLLPSLNYNSFPCSWLYAELEHNKHCLNAAL
jgi:hypothetical protein